MTNNQKINLPEKYKKHIIPMSLALICLILLTFCLTLCHQQSRLKRSITDLSAEYNQKIDNARKIYIFNMEKAVQSSDIMTRSQKFEADVATLDAEVEAAKKKIKSIKDDKIKGDVSNMYLKSLQMKRDDIVAEYQSFMTDMLAKMNTTLATIAEEQKAPAIFSANSLVVVTGNVVDVTDEVVRRIQPTE